MSKVFLGALIMLALAAPTTAAAQWASAPWSHLTIITETGETYPDVSLTWIGQGESVLVTRADGATMNLAPARIVAITNREGLDRRADFFAQRHAPGQQAGPAKRSAGDFAEIRTTTRTLASRAPDAPADRKWLFNWSFGLGPGRISTFGGDFPGASAETILSSTIRRRIYKRQYLSLVSHSQMHLADQFVADWQSPDMILVEWQESQLFLMYGHYYRPGNWYWELGVGALERTLSRAGDSGEGKHFKGAFRCQFGRLIELSRQFAIDLGLFTTLKPGFRDNSGGLAADLGLRAELVVW